MQLRRVIALVVLVLVVFCATQLAPQLPGVLPLVSYIVATFVAIGAVGVLLFNLPARRSGPVFADSGYNLANPTDFGVSALCILLFATAPLFIAVRGVLRGVLPAFGSGQDVAFSTDPWRFLFCFAVFVAWGVGCLYLLWRVWLSRKELVKSTRSVGANRDA